MKSSIRNRLLFTLLSLTAAIWLVTAWSGYQETKHEVGEIFDAQLAQSARSMLLLASHELQELADATSVGDHIHFIPDSPQLGSGHPYEQKMAYQIRYLKENTLVLRSANAPTHPLSDATTGYTDRTIDGELWRVFTLTDTQSGYQVQMAESYGLRKHLINHIAMRLLMPNLLALPLLALLISFGIHRGLAPLRTLTQAVARRAADSLEPVEEQDIPREIEPLVEALNQLFLRLQEAFENERRFTADAAHELRTPLAALKVQAQVAKRATSDQQRQQALDNLLHGVDRATRLVEQLLTLARLDPQQRVALPGSVALYQLAAEVIADLDNSAHTKGIEVTLSGDETGTVAGQSDTLRMLITNLLDNALRYTPAQGQILVTLQKSGDGAVVLSVDDSGPGIAEAERERVLQRFYRGENVTASGSGLGLSIVKRSADLHQATLSLADSALGGLRVTVTFPPLPHRPS